MPDNKGKDNWIYWAIMGILGLVGLTAIAGKPNKSNFTSEQPKKFGCGCNGGQ